MTTAASYESIEAVNEATAARVSAMVNETPAPGAVLHAMSDDVIHEVVLHIVEPTRTLGVRLLPPKLEPMIVS